MTGNTRENNEEREKEKKCKCMTWGPSDSYAGLQT